MTQGTGHIFLYFQTQDRLCNKNCKCATFLVDTSVQRNRVCIFLYKSSLLKDKKPIDQKWNKVVSCTNTL